MSASEQNDETYTCPLCGHKFKKDDEKCRTCPLAMGGKCNVVCCPNCGYSFSEDSRVVDWFRKKFGHEKKGETSGGD